MIRQLGNSGAANVMIGAVAFLLTSALLQLVLPMPEMEQITPKLRHLAEHGGEYDVIFVGSSRVYHGVSPEVFDTEVASAGRHCHSFNFGIDAMHPPERSRILEKILQIPAVKPRWIFLEFDDLQANIPEEEKTERAIYWHDAGSTWLVIRKLLNLTPHFHRRDVERRLAIYWPEIRWHLRAFARRQFSVGRASDLFDAALRRCGIAARLTESSLSERGFDPYDGDLSDPAAAAYQAQVALMPRAAAEPVDVLTHQSFADAVRRIRSSGAAPFLFVTPVAGQFPPTNFGGNPPAPLLAFNDRSKFPNLYEPDVRIDGAHLNHKGADEFTRLLASQFLQAVGRQ